MENYLRGPATTAVARPTRTRPPGDHLASPRPTRGPGRRTALTAAVLVSAVMASLAVTTGVAAAAVPTAPNNIVAFPNRDFISVEGYEDRAGQVATTEVTRAGVGVIGSARSTVAAGGVAFEINHPGGQCWGAGTGLNITPDLQPGDVITVRFPDGFSDDIRVQDAAATGDAVQGTGPDANRVIVRGHIGPGVNTANTEQRIVEPALVDTNIGKRDIRAIPGPLTPSPKGGYSSSLEFDGSTFTATYVFDDPDGAGPGTGADNAVIAANASLGERLLSWESVDAAGNRQGITIAEFGEVGGPGFGGCPNGPLQAGPVGPTDVVATILGSDIGVTWKPAVPIPGTPPITGYRVHAVEKAVVASEQDEIGKRVTGVGATGTRITGLSGPPSGFDVEVVSVSSVGTTFPAIPAIPAIDTAPPTVTSSVPGGTFQVPQLINLTSNEPNTQIFFTLDGTNPIDPVNSVPSDTATLFTAPFSVSGNETLKFGGFDASGNASVVTTHIFTITNAPTPEAPVFGLPDVDVSAILVRWTPVVSVPAITAFGVQVSDQDGAAVGPLREVAGDVTSLNVTGLAPETLYFFTVQAKNVNGYGPVSSPVGLTTLGTVIANAGPDRSVARGTAPKTVALTGAGSTTVGAGYKWEQVDAGPNPVVMAATDQLAASFTLPLFGNTNTNAPLKFRLTVTVSGGGTKSDDVLVTPVPDQIAISSAKWKVGDFRVVGTGSLVNATITIHRGSPTGPVIGASVPVTAAAPPAVGDVNQRLRTAAQGVPGANPGTIYVESSAGGRAGPFTVANG
jgi:hypothetical protein